MTQYSATFEGRAHTLLLTLTEGAKDLSTLKVRVDYKLEIVKGVNRTTWNNGAGDTQPWSIVLGGTTVASGTSIPFNFDVVSHGGPAPGTRFTIKSGSYQFSYDADGTLGLSVVFSADADVWDGGTHGSGTKIMGVASYPSSGTVTFSPSDISVATQPEVVPKSATVGSTVTVLLPRKDAAYTHDVTWESGALSGSIGTGLGTSTTWTVPDVTGEFPTREQSPITITAVTKNGSTDVGSKSATLLVWNVAPDIDPTLTSPFDVRTRLVEWDGSRLRATNPVVHTGLKLTDTASATPTLSLTTSGVIPGSDEDLDGAIVLLDVQTGLSWQSTGLLFVLSRAEGDDTDLSDSASYSGTGFLDFELARGYRTKDWKRKGSGTNAGFVMNFLLDEGHDKGWGPNIASSFPTGKTSVGDGWTISGGTRELSGGTPYSQILEALVNDGWAEWRGRYDDTDGKCYLDLFNPVTGSDWTNASSEVIVNLSTAAVSEAPTTWSLEGVLDRVYAIGDAATGSSSTTADNTPAPIGSSERTPYNANVFGVLEGWVSASGQTTTSGARDVATNALDNATITNSREFTYSAYAVPRNLLPYYTYKPGDWILIPADGDRSADPIVMRVTQVILDRTDDGFNITVTCGDLIPSSAAASVMKKIKASTGGHISGGTLRDPIPLQSIIPAAPNFLTEEAATSTGYWASDGTPGATIAFEWEEVTTAMDGVTPVVVDYYEIWWRPNPSVQWALKTFSVGTSVEMDGWPIYTTVQLRVRARAAGNGAFGEFSAWDEVTTVAPTASIEALAVDALYTDGLGNIFADWDGYLGDSSAVPSYFAYMSAEISPDVAGAPSGVWTVKGNPLQAAGTVTLNPGSFGTWWIRFRAYDALGGPGVNGTAESITTVDPGLVPPPTPEAPTGVAVVAGAGWDILGTSSGDYLTVSWTAVTEDTDSNPVDIALYEVEGDDGSGEWVNVLRFTGVSYDIPVVRGSSWTYRVRAVSAAGGISDWSTPVGPTTADATLTSLEAPSVPDVSSAKGLLYVSWDGLDDTGEPYPNSSGIRYAYVEISPEDPGTPGSPDGTWTRRGTAFPGRAGTAIISDLLRGANYFARIVVADGVGGTVAGGASAMETLTGIQGSDVDPNSIGGGNLDPDFADGATITGAVIQTDAAASAGIKLDSTGIVAFDSAGNPTFLVDAGTGSVWFGTGTIAGEAIDVSTIDVGTLQASLITNGMGDALTISGTSLVSIIAGMQGDITSQGTDLATYFDFGAPGQWQSDGGSAVTGLRIAGTDATDAFNSYAFPGGFQIRRGATAIAWWEADPASPSIVRFVTPNITVLNDLNVGAHKFRPGAAGVTIVSAQ